MTTLLVALTAIFFGGYTAPQSVLTENSVEHNNNTPAPAPIELEWQAQPAIIIDEHEALLARLIKDSGQNKPVLDEAPAPALTNRACSYKSGAGKRLNMPGF